MPSVIRVARLGVVSEEMLVGRNSNLQASDPAVSSRVANVLARAYIEQNLEFKFMSSKDASDWLGHLGHQQAVTQEQSLTNALEQQKRDALALNRTGIEYGVLARDAAETPRGPVRPNTRNNLLLALFGGAVLAIGLALFFDYLDNRFGCFRVADEDVRQPRLPRLVEKDLRYDRSGRRVGLLRHC